MPGPQRTAPPRRGRPRLDSRPVIGDPQQAILDAAARMVGELGVSATSISGIAKAVGLTQSSVYYYFANKTEILVALMNRVIVVPIDSLDRVVAGGGSPAVRLYQFVRNDVVTICQLDLDSSEILRYAMRDRVAFASYWDHVAHMQAQVTELVRRGIAEGELCEIDPEVAASIILGNNEGALNRFRWESRWTPETLGRHLADLVVRGMLVDPGQLEEIRRRADALDLN